MTENAAPYAWLITHDSIADPGYPLGTNSNARGVVGPRNAPDDLEHILHQAATIGRAKYSKYPENTPVRWFKMYDDDGNLYYSGVITGELEEDGFEPLDDFGKPNAGATEIRYWNPATDEWEEL